MTTTANETARLYEQARAAKAASKELAKLSTEVKNRALLNLADALEAREDEIMAANRLDFELAQDAGLTGEMLGRLELSPGGFRSMVASVRSVASLPDPIGQMEDVRLLDNGLRIGRRRVPLGVIASVYESRPEVTVDIPSLCLKSGNAAFLRGGKEAINCNTTLAGVVRDAIGEAGVPPDAVQFVESTDRALVAEMLKMKDWIDLIVPRGGGGLIEFVEKHATMSAITGGRGVNHIYVDRSAPTSTWLPTSSTTPRSSVRPSATPSTACSCTAPSPRPRCPASGPPSHPPTSTCAATRIRSAFCSTAALSPSGPWRRAIGATSSAP